MPIRLNYTFYAGDGESATTFNQMILEALKGLVPEGVVIDPTFPSPSSDSEHWDAGASIYLADGSADPARESALAHDIADGIGSPWEKYDDGRTRVRLPGTGGFHQDFSLMKWAELKLVAPEDLRSSTPGAPVRQGRKSLGLSGGGLYLLAGKLFRGAGKLCMLAGLLVLAGQAAWWAMSGDWLHVPLFLPFAFLADADGVLFGWMADPASWYGLSKVVLWGLKHMPFSLFLIVAGVVLKRFFQLPGLKNIRR